MRLQPVLLSRSLAPLLIAVVVPKAAVPLFILVALVTIPWKRIRDPHLWGGAACLAWVLLPAWGAVTAFWALDVQNAVSVSGKLALFALAALLMTRAARIEPGQIRDLAHINLVCLAAALIVVWVKAALAQPDYQGISFAKNTGTLMALLTFPAIAAMAMAGWARWRMAVLIVLAVLGCYWSLSTSAVMGLAAGLSVLAIGARYPVLLRKGLILTLPLVPLLAPIVPFLAEPRWFVENVPSFNTAFYHRLVIWDFVLEHIGQQPWLGWGMDASRSLGAKRTFMHVLEVPWLTEPYIVGGELLPLHPHNAWLQVWLELGVVGAVLVSWLLWRVARSAAAHPDNTLLALLVAIMAIASFAYGTWQSWWVAAVLLCWNASRVQGLIPTGQ